MIYAKTAWTSLSAAAAVALALAVAVAVAAVVDRCDRIRERE